MIIKLIKSYKLFQLYQEIKDLWIFEKLDIIFLQEKNPLKLEQVVKLYNCDFFRNFNSGVIQKKIYRSTNTNIYLFILLLNWKLGKICFITSPLLFCLINFIKLIIFKIKNQLYFLDKNLPFK